MRTCLSATVMILTSALLLPAIATAQPKDQTLYNGIRLSSPWPPILKSLPVDEPIQPPYLVSPPNVIPIDVGGPV
jgi:hypothetical protein